MPLDDDFAAELELALAALEYEDVVARFPEGMTINDIPRSVGELEANVAAARNRQVGERRAMIMPPCALSVNDRVHHINYGPGSVVEITSWSERRRDHLLLIQFDRSGRTQSIYAKVISCAALERDLTPAQRKAQNDDVRARSAGVRLAHQQRKLDSLPPFNQRKKAYRPPVQYQDMYRDFHQQFGAVEARRLVEEHTERMKRPRKFSPGVVVRTC